MQSEGFMITLKIWLTKYLLQFAKYLDASHCSNYIGINIALVFETKWKFY